MTKPREAVMDSAETVTECCPTCGQALPISDDVRVDEIAGVICRNGKFATFSQREMSLFLELRRRPGRLRSRQELHHALYWLRAEHEEPGLKIIDVTIFKMRKKLAPLSLGIENVRAAGYRLVVSDGAQC